MTTVTPVGTADGRRRSLLILTFAALTALALVVFMITSVTRAAWTDTTDNTGNSWATGTVTLTDDDGDTAMFSASDMIPGEVVANDITVTNESTTPLNVKLYGNLADPDLLAQYLNLNISTVSSGAHDVYDNDTGVGTLLGFDTTHSDFASGTDAISLSPGATQTYYFWVELDANTPTESQGATATMDFVWEGQTP